jgi:hypothetical protein
MDSAPHPRCFGPPTPSLGQALSVIILVNRRNSMKKCGGCEHFVKWRNDAISDFCEKLDARVTSDSRACGKFQGLSKAKELRILSGRGR